MKPNSLKKGILTENSVGVGTVTREMVEKRAIELGIINGHPSHTISKSDLDQARRELTGGSDIDPLEDILESVPESERWEPVYGSTGHKVENSMDEDEDAEGRTDSEKLVEEGIEEAEHDQMLQAARNQRENEK